MSERCQHEHKHSSCQKGVTIWNRLHLLSERCYNLKVTPLVRKVLQSETDGGLGCLCRINTQGVNPNTSTNLASVLRLFLFTKALAKEWVEKKHQGLFFQAVYWCCICIQFCLQKHKWKNGLKRSTNVSFSRLKFYYNAERGHRQITSSFPVLN